MVQLDNLILVSQLEFLFFFFLTHFFLFVRQFLFFIILLIFKENITYH